MESQLESFRQAWHDVRGLTYAFIEAVPEAKWDHPPHPRFASLHKQVRHLVCVQGVYHQGLVQRSADFGRKHAHYAGPLERSALLAALREKDAQLEAILADLGDAGAERFSLEFFGKTMRFSRYTAVMIQHEAIHHGQWSFYAALGGYATPRAWQLNWGL